MQARKYSTLLLAIVFGASTLLAQETPVTAVGEKAVVSEEVPCFIDEQLSLWLALETVDRTIVGLMRERRSLSEELAAVLKTLDLLSLSEDPDGVPFVQLNELAQAKSKGRDVIDVSHIELQNNLIELEKTLSRRRKQQAMLEERLEMMSREDHDRAN